MNYLNFIDRQTGEIFAYDMDDGAQVLSIREGLEALDDKELLEIREAQAAAVAPTPEQIAQAAIYRRDDLLALAGLRIAPLQDAVDLDVATAAEVASLKQWKQYRIAVGRIAAQPGFPLTLEWPEQPSK